MKKMDSVQDVANFSVGHNRKLFSAEHSEIMAGLTTDVYFVKTNEILERSNLGNVPVIGEIFARKSGVAAGIPEAINLLQNSGVKVWGISEGEEFEPKDVLLRIEGTYTQFGIYETAILGILASSCGWATAARRAKAAAGDKPVICFGARHLHPAVAPVMERSAIIGGADGAACILGAKLLQQEPVGTVPHALFLVMGDTVRAAEAYHAFMPADSPRTILVDTFKDEVEESLRLCESLGENLQGVRLDTPGERGGVTPGLVHELRAKLDLAGYTHVKIFVSGGLDPDRICLLSAAGADAFGVGSFISAASPIDMTMDLKVVDGKPVAKRGRIPGLTGNKELPRLL